MEYYSNQTLLSKLDINNKKPEIYICTGNRTAGKTFNFNSYLVNQYLKNKSQFMLLYRNKYELEDVDKKFYSDIEDKFYPHVLTTKYICKKNFVEIYLDDKICGFAVSLRGADIVKKYSHYFNNVQRMLFDEFQSEDNVYLPNEVDKLISIHTSVARGHGKAVRYVPVYLLSNTVSILNPYYSALGIAERIQEKTRYLRGDGFVFELTLNKAASEKQKESAFNRAFAGNKQIDFMIENIYLNDNKCLIDKNVNKTRYICTLKNESNFYGVYFTDAGFYYIDNTYDKTNTFILACNVGDVDDVARFDRSSMTINTLRRAFNNGMFRFKNLECKKVIIDLLHY